MFCTVGIPCRKFANTLPIKSPHNIANSVSASQSSSFHTQRVGESVYPRPLQLFTSTSKSTDFLKEGFQMASDRVARAASRHVTALLLMFLFLTHFAAAAGESNSKAVQHGREHYYPDKNLHVYSTFQRTTPAALEEAEDLETTREPHPADELLQSQDADGSQSYILGGY